MGDGNKSQHAHSQLWQTMLTVFIHLETTVVDYEVDVSGGCPRGERVEEDVE